MTKRNGKVAHGAQGDIPLTKKLRGFTLIEVLIVVAIVGILSAIAVPNFARALERSLIASDASNMRVIGSAIVTYYIEQGNYPPGDSTAGGFQSHLTSNFGNAPAAGGNWSAVPWVLYDLGYVNDWQTLICPKYVRLYKSGVTLQPEMGETWQKYHNFRYAYNASALSPFFNYITEGGDVYCADSANMYDNGWILRDLFIPSEMFYVDGWGTPPYDWQFPWGDGEFENKIELVMKPDMVVRPIIGRTSFCDSDVDAPQGAF